MTSKQVLFRRLSWRLDSIISFWWRDFLVSAWLGYGWCRCEACGSFRGLAKRPSRTMYPWDGKGKNPNAARLLCLPCTDEHNAFWDEMWADYYHGRL